MWFDHAQGLSTHGLPVTAFEVAGPDRHFVPADAHLDGETVVVRSASLPRPVYVRYGWSSFVEHALYNAEGLPTSTFTSEPDPREQ